VIDPAKTCLFIPAGLKDFKLNLFERIGAKLGRVIRGDVAALAALPPDIIPIVGCSPELRETIARWRSAGRTFVYWDRGYWDRVFATWLPRGANGGMYRWHVNSFQLQALRDVPADRYEARKPPVKDWQRNGRHIVIAAPTRTYAKFHGTRDWIADTIDALARVTDRQLVIRDKESKRPLQDDLEGAHCLVTHGSIAAVESVILGCPVFVHQDSAAALVGRTDIRMVEKPSYPDRDLWLRSLACSQWNETELCDGTLWRSLS
jgi:hypothetical protein